jgi:hypothetical protein
MKKRVRKTPWFGRYISKAIKRGEIKCPYGFLRRFLGNCPFNFEAGDCAKCPLGERVQKLRAKRVQELRAEQIKKAGDQPEPEYVARKTDLPLPLVLNVFRFFGIPHKSPDDKRPAIERRNRTAARRTQ